MRTSLVTLAAVLALAAPASPAGAAANDSPAETASTKTTRANGHRIGYRDFGTGSPVVFVPGYAVSMDYWDPRFLDMVAERHRVIVFDHRGVGRSTGSLDGLSIATLSDDAAALVRALRLRNVTLVGHSMGGSVAQQLVVDHGRLIRRLALLAASPDGANAVISPEVGELAPPFDPYAPNEWSFASARAARSYVRRAQAHRDFHRVSAEVQQAQWPIGGQWMFGDAGDAAWEHLPELRTPALVAGGKDDPITPFENSRRLAAQIPDAKLVGLAGLRHLFFAERSDLFVPKLERFIRRNGG